MKAAIASDADEMIDHRSADPLTSRHLGGVHGLQLCVASIKLLKGSDSEELTFEAEAEEHDSRIEEAIDVKRMDVLGWSVQIGEREVVLQQLENVLGSRVVNRDLALRHGTNLRDPKPDSHDTLPSRS